MVAGVFVFADHMSPRPARFNSRFNLLGQSSFLSCFGRAAFLPVSFTSNSNFSFKIVWLASVHQALLKSEILSPQRSLFVGFSRLLVCATSAFN